MATAILDPVSTSLIPEVCLGVTVVPTVQAKGSEFDQRTEAWANAVIQSHPHLKMRAELIKCECRNKCLQVSGVLPSFYFKQLAQEALRSSCRDLRIENRILVINSKDEFQS